MSDSPISTLDVHSAGLDLMKIRKSHSISRLVIKCADDESPVFVAVSDVQ